MMTTSQISLAEMVDLLFQYGEAQGLDVTYQGIARATGQTWNNIRKIRVGENTNPGLQVIQALAEYFSVKLDYFNCRTADECEAYLGRIAEQEMEDTTVRMRSRGLSPEGLETLQAMIDYVKRAEGLMNDEPGE